MTKNVGIPLKSDKQTALAELYEVNWDQANALSGLNPPTRPPQVDDGSQYVAIIFRYFIPLTFVVIWLLMIIKIPISELIFYAIVFTIMASVSWAVGGRFEAQKAPTPSPTLYILQPIQTEFLKLCRGSEITVRLRYDIPTTTDNNRAAPLLSLLTLETEEALDRLIDESDKVFAEATDDQRKKMKNENPIDTDILECLLTPVFGRIVYESQIPVFRFNITLKKSRPAPIEHDIEVGEVIDGVV